KHCTRVWKSCSTFMTASSSNGFSRPSNASRECSTSSASIMSSVMPRGSAAGCVAAALLLLAAGCKHFQPLDSKPLDAAGVSYDSIKKLEALKIAQEEVPEIGKMRRAGFSDDSCVSIVEIYHQRSKPFAAGDTVAGLVKASVGENTILELARMDQLGLGAGEF